MAVQFDPIAKDESLNTTEQTTRNIADVLAQELSGIATAISGGSDKVPKTDIATVEPTNVASRAYNIGELVYVNGNLYKVITAISLGSAFTVGTNIQTTNVSKAIGESVNYSTAERVVGKWIDGSTIYEKTISLGVLPNATSKNVAHGITNFGQVISLTGIAQRPSPFRCVNIPYVHSSDLATQIQIVVIDTYLTVYTGADWSSFTSNYVTLRYTKSS